jgi:hypothetical protein
LELPQLILKAALDVQAAEFIAGVEVIRVEVQGVFEGPAAFGLPAQDPEAAADPELDSGGCGFVRYQGRGGAVVVQGRRKDLRPSLRRPRFAL